MAIIRDNDLGGLAMIPLFVDWHVRRCNYVGCKAQPTTIITGEDAGEAHIFGLCEKHWEEASQPGGTTLHLEFDNFDAFKKEVRDGS